MLRSHIHSSALFLCGLGNLTELLVLLATQLVPWLSVTVRTGFVKTKLFEKIINLSSIFGLY